MVGGLAKPAVSDATVGETLTFLASLFAGDSTAQTVPPA